MLKRIVLEIIHSIQGHELAKSTRRQLWHSCLGKNAKFNSYNCSILYFQVMSSLQPWWFLQYLRLRHLILKLVLFRQFFGLKRQNKRGLVAATIRQCKSGPGSASKKVISFTFSISQLQSSFDLKVRVLNPTREFGISSQTCPTLIIVLKRQGKRCLFASILLR